MKQYIFVGLLMVCVGCGGESLTSGPSPLETYDQDRLYVLINAAVSRGRAVDCVRYFQEADNQASDNPNAEFMRAALSQVCPESMVKIAAYLEHNGVAGVKPAHVKDMAFWERMQAKANAANLQELHAKRAGDAAVTECRKQVDNIKREKGNPKSTVMLLKDFPDAQAYRAAWDEARLQEQKEEKEHRAARKACEGTRWSPPSREDLGINLPEGMRLDGVGRIN